MMTTATRPQSACAEPISLADIPVLEPDQFRTEVVEDVARGARIAALFGWPRDASGVRLVAVLAQDHLGALSVLATDVGASYPALTPDCPRPTGSSARSPNNGA